jgi:peptide subunit release factor 1 (eRF1)
MSRITAKDLGELRGSRAGAGKVLSVYLDIDQSKAANLNRRFECGFDSRIQLIERKFEEVNPTARVVLTGNAQAVSELFRLMPKSFRGRIAGSAVMPGNASEQEILESTLALARRAERVQELEKVDRLLTASAKADKAVVSVPRTLQAFNEDRVRELIYAEGFSAAGGICDTCHVMFASDDVNCEICGMPVKSADDLVENSIAAALTAGAAVEQVRGPAAEKLRNAGGIGAFLRF